MAWFCVWSGKQQRPSQLHAMTSEYGRPNPHQKHSAKLQVLRPTGPPMPDVVPREIKFVDTGGALKFLLPCQGCSLQDLGGYGRYHAPPTDRSSCDFNTIWSDSKNWLRIFGCDSYRSSLNESKMCWCCYADSCWG